ncbi:diguanylate cyclase [Pseudoalteromonas sp. SMS1]|uniref:diguanylate cyclase domain-containing protein n=1 Tax=Pseudoalteromonas sp. SMS1 TaxID=2908894 RepID=UPI001F449DA8|nr:diguanylate cyclase [Pseudoalteromonas sp. SMS1]MCF2858045.1 diguanylate cyclase [Pseudoalteromonas sp. SMS1]
MRLQFVILFLWLFSGLSAAMTKQQILEFESHVIENPIKILTEKDKPEGVSRAFWLTLKARAAFFKGDIQSAKQFYDNAKGYVKEKPLSLSSGYWYLYRAFFSIEQGELVKAKQYIKQARLSFTQQKASDLLIRTDAMEAVISVWREEYNLALKSLQTAQGYISRNPAGVDDTTKLMVYDSLTAYYLTLQFYVKALGYAYQAQELARANGNLLDGLPVKYNMCLVLLRSNLIDKAEQCYQEMHELAHVRELPRYEFWGLSGLGKIALNKKEFEDAIGYLQRAQLVQENAIINPAHLIVLNNNLALSYSELKQFDQALEQLSLSKVLLKSYDNALNNRYTRQTLKIEADVYQAKQDFPQTIAALRTYVKFLEENDAVSKNKTELYTNGLLESQRQKYQLVSSPLNSDSPAVSQREELKKHDLIKAYIVIALLVIALLAVVAYYRRSRSNLTEVLNYKDFGTGLYNRRYFVEQFEVVSNRAIDYAMALIELEGVRDPELQSRSQEERLKTVADLILKQFRDDGDLVCRVSEEEFVILCEGMKKVVLQKRLSAFNTALKSQENLINIRFSGALICSEEGDFGNIFAELESRLVHVKRNAPGQVVAF